jgi:hypothetical protein
MTHRSGNSWEMTCFQTKNQTVENVGTYAPYFGALCTATFSPERKRSDFLLETTGIPTQTFLRGAALCLYKTGVIFYEV